MFLGHYAGDDGLFTRVVEGRNDGGERNRDHQNVNIGDVENEVKKNRHPGQRLTNAGQRQALRGADSINPCSRYRPGAGGKNTRDEEGDTRSFGGAGQRQNNDGRGDIAHRV